MHFEILYLYFKAVKEIILIELTTSTLQLLALTLRLKFKTFLNYLAQLRTDSFSHRMI